MAGNEEAVSVPLWDGGGRRCFMDERSQQPFGIFCGEFCMTDDSLLVIFISPEG